jgi:WD40 repeat protein
MRKDYFQYLLRVLTVCWLFALLSACDSSSAHNGLPATPTPYLHIRPYTVAGHADMVTAQAWSPNERFIASAGKDGVVIVWNALNGQTVSLYHSPSAVVTSLAWSPDSTRLVSGGSDGVAQTWDATTGSSVLSHHMAFGAVYAVAWSPNGQFIAAGAAVVDIWNARTGRLIRSLSSTNVFGPTDLQWSPDSQRLAVGLDNNLGAQIWSLTSSKMLLSYRPPSQLRTLAWSPDGQFIVSGDVNGTIQVWNARNGTRVTTYKGHTHGTGISRVCWMPDGQRIISSSRDGTVQIWRATTGQKLFTYRDPSGDIEAMAVSPDGSYIVTGGIDHKERVALLA